MSGIMNGLSFTHASFFTRPTMLLLVLEGDVCISLIIDGRCVKWMIEDLRAQSASFMFLFRP